MLSRRRFLFLLQYAFAYVEKTVELADGTKAEKLEKHIMRYQQLFATLALRQKLSEGVKGGVIWHTQGSGKTAFAYYNVKCLTDFYAERDTVAKFFFIVDRLDLLEKNAFRFCFVVDFPMYEINEETKKLDFTHNPFSMPQGGLEALENQDPLEILAYQYDLVCNGIELASGAVRNHSVDIMKKAFALAGYTEEELAARFSALYTAFQYGAPPHAGMAPGIDRMIMLLADTETIRNVIAFPLNGNAQDLLLGAPSQVTEQQLREANIQIREEA
jgi:aspartyl-tRNA synthetase